MVHHSPRGAARRTSRNSCRARTGSFGHSPSTFRPPDRARSFHPGESFHASSSAAAACSGACSRNARADSGRRLERIALQQRFFAQQAEQQRDGCRLLDVANERLLRNPPRLLLPGRGRPAARKRKHRAGILRCPRAGLIIRFPPVRLIGKQAPRRRGVGCAGGDQPLEVARQKNIFLRPAPGADERPAQPAGIP